MTKRNIGKEVIEGLEEVKVWRQGKTRLKTFTIETRRAAEASAIRKGLDSRVRIGDGESSNEASDEK